MIIVHNTFKHVFNIIKYIVFQNIALWNCLIARNIGSEFRIMPAVKVKVKSCKALIDSIKQSSRPCSETRIHFDCCTRNIHKQVITVDYIASPSNLYGRSTDVPKYIPDHKTGTRTVIVIDCPYVELRYQVVEIIVPDYTSPFSGIASIVYGAVIFNIHAQPVQFASLHRLVVSVQKYALGIGIVDTAGAYTVADTVEFYSRPIA